MSISTSHRLSELRTGACAVIVSVTADGAMRRRLTDLGFTVGTTVRCVGKSPLGDPRAYLVRGAVIALRRRDAATVLTKEVRTP